jgi:transcriptional regulator with XRE-family HTH domain
MTNRATKEDYDRFRKRLRFLRKKADISQQKLADLIGISISTVSETERGVKTKVPKRADVAEYGRVLNDKDNSLLKAAGYDSSPLYGAEGLVDAQILKKVTIKGVSGYLIETEDGQGVYLYDAETMV